MALSLTSSPYPVSTAKAAHELYALGLNVVPRPVDPSAKWPWRPLLSTRLTSQDLSDCFSYPCNIGILPGRLSGNLLILRTSSHVMYRVIGVYLQSHGIPRWSVISGEDPGGYYLLHIDEGEVQNVSMETMQQSGIWQDTEIIASGEFVLTPPSVSLETGARFEWDMLEGETPPTVSINDLQHFPLQLAADPIPRAYHGPWGTLSARTRTFIEQGDRREVWNNELFLAARDCDGCGFNTKEAAERLWPAMENSGLDPDKAYDEFRLTIDNAYQCDNNLPSVLHEWQYALARMQSFPWPTRTRKADVAVCKALIQRARDDAHSGVFRASERELVELSGITRKTVRKALWRLREYRVIETAGLHSPSGARQWRFASAFLREDESIENYPTTPTTMDSGVIFDHDVWHPGALGDALEVWVALSDVGRPARRKEIVSLTNLSPGQVSYRLRKLRTYGMVEYKERRWEMLPVTRGRLDEIAREAGTLGYRESKRHQHMRERAKRAAALILKARGIDHKQSSAYARQLRAQFNARRHRMDSVSTMNEGVW